MAVTLDDWTKLLDVALRETQHTCVTLTEVPASAQDLRSLIALAQVKAGEAGLQLSKIELPADRFGETSEFPGAIGLATDVVRLSFSAAAPAVHGRRIVLLSRNPPQPLAKLARQGGFRGTERRAIGQRRMRDHASPRVSDHR
jgi:hypothetical protein